MDRMKCFVKSAPEGAWYKPFVGKFFWISRRTFDETAGTYNLKYANQDLTLAKADIIIIPWPFRKLFHGINCEISVPRPETPGYVVIEDDEDSSDTYEDYDDGEPTSEDE